MKLTQTLVQRLFVSYSHLSNWCKTPGLGHLLADSKSDTFVELADLVLQLHSFPFTLAYVRFRLPPEP